MDIVSFKQAFDPLLARHLASKHDAYTRITTNPTVLSILSHIQNVSTGGKRLRPFIIWSLYSSHKEDASLEEIGSLLIAIELFHVFCLIHDDIMDEAPLRHGTPTIHTHTQNLLQTKDSSQKNIFRASESQAILTGDIVFNHVYELLNTVHWGTHEIREEIKHVFATLVDEVCIGQMLDIDLTTQRETDMGAIVEKNKLKTAYYSFARPLHIGTIISNRKDLTDFVLSFGEKIGMLFQIQDDLLDIVGDPHKTKKEPFADLQENQHTVLTEYIRKKADPVFKTQLETLCGTPKGTLDPSVVRSLFIDSGSVAYAQALIKEYTVQSEQCIADAHLDTHDSNIFYLILSLLSQRTS